MNATYSLNANPYLAPERIYCDLVSGQVPDPIIHLFKSAGVKFNPGITDSNYPINHIINVAQIISDPLHKEYPKPENSESFINDYYKTLNKTIVQLKEVPKESVTMLMLCSDSNNDSILGLKKALEIGVKINKLYILIISGTYTDEVRSNIDKVFENQPLNLKVRFIVAKLLLPDACINNDFYSHLFKKLEKKLRNKRCMIACSYNSIYFIREEFQKQLTAIGADYQGIFSVLTETAADLPKEQQARLLYIQAKYDEESRKIEETKEVWLKTKGIYS